MKTYIFKIGLLLILSILTINALADPNSVHKPKITDKYGNSQNWAGYAVDAGVGTVTDVKGSWIVPTVDCTVTPSAYSAFWVGIDGDIHSNTVEQTGTDSDCNSGNPTYYAWFEFYPKPSFRINTISVHPGDIMSAEVKWAGGNQFKATITDTSTTPMQSYTASGSVKAQRNSAEWIAESPSGSGGILPLADFGVADYGIDYTNIGSTNYATIKGCTGSIGSFGPSQLCSSAGGTINPITMVGSSGTKAFPSPTPVPLDGTSFNVQWVSSS